MSTKNRRHTLDLAFALAFILLGLSSCPKDIKSEPWFKLAQKYIEADQTMLRNEVEKKGTFLEDIVVRDDAAAQLLKVSGPSISKSDELLRSNHEAARKAAIVDVMLRGSRENQLLATIFDTYRIEDDRSAKFYSVMCLVDVEEADLKALEDRLIKIFSIEKDEVIIISALRVLARLDPHKTKPLFVKYLKNGTHDLRAVTIIALAEKDLDFVKQLEKELESEGINIWEGLSKWRLPERLKSYEKER